MGGRLGRPEVTGVTSVPRVHGLGVGGLLAVILASTLAGCSQTTAAQGSAPSKPSPAPSPPASSGVTPFATPSPSTSPTTAVVAAAACTSSQLQIAFLGVSGAAGNVTLEFEVRNAGSAACELSGWPRVQLLNAAGDPLPTLMDTNHVNNGGQRPASTRRAASRITPNARVCGNSDSVQRGSLNRPGNPGGSIP
jgi:hypothetical protein